METNENLEGNKLIAEFMNIKNEFSDIYYMPQFGHYSNSYGQIEFNECFRLNELKYNSSWDWLIPVIDKIFDLDEYIKYKDSLSQFSEGIIINTKFIESTFEHVVDFIKWYNLNNK